jgi:hypothetical protein
MLVDPIINETQINILLDTNIPNEKPFSFTKNILYNELLKDTSSFSEYPYFSSVIPYPEDKLKKLDYVNQVAFFFKKEDFIKILKETSDYKSLSETLKKEENEKKELIKRKINGEDIKIDIEKFEFKINDKNKNINIKKNIMIMLSVIFPINYPIHNNIINSYDSIFLGLTSFSSSSLSSIIPFLLSITLGIKSTKQKYSYIKSPSKGICTVTQIVWLNDLYNHPEYKKIISEYLKFQEWKIIEFHKKEKDLKKEYEKFKKTYNIGLKKLYESLNNISKPNDKFKQTYYGYTDKDYLKEFTFIKEILPEILKFNEIDDSVINNLVKFKISFNILREKIGKELQDIRKDFNQNKIKEDIEKLEMIYEIMNTYLNQKELKIEKTIEKEDYQYKLTDYDKEYENLKNKIKREWKEYDKYLEFIKLIQTYIRPNNESSNDDLQNLIEKFIIGEDSENNFEKLLTQSIDQSPSIETGINIKKNDPIQNTIYVRMDVIVGEINDENKNSINCIFNGEYLGNELNRLLKPSKKTFELDSNRFYFDLNSIKNSKSNGSSTNQPSIKQPIITNGGKKNISRKKRNNK